MSSSYTTASGSLVASTSPPTGSPLASMSNLPSADPYDDSPAGISFGFGITFGHRSPTAPSETSDSSPSPNALPGASASSPSTSTTIAATSTSLSSSTAPPSTSTSSTATQVPACPANTTSLPISTEISTGTAAAASSILLMSTPTSPSERTSSGRPGLSSGAAAGIAAALSTVATCLVLASFLYIRRRVRREAVARVDPFVGTLSSDEDRDGSPTAHWTLKGARPEPQPHGVDLTAVTIRRPLTLACFSTGSLVACRAATMDSGRSDGLSSLSPSQTESIDRLLALEKVLREWRTRSLRTSGGGNTATVVQTDGVVDVASSSAHGMERSQGTQPEADREGMAAGGSVEEIVADAIHGSVGADGSTLPPAYSSHRSET